MVTFGIKALLVRTMFLYSFVLLNNRLGLRSFFVVQPVSLSVTPDQRGILRFYLKDDISNGIHDYIFGGNNPIGNPITQKHEVIGIQGYSCCYVLDSI